MAIRAGGGGGQGGHDGHKEEEEGSLTCGKKNNVGELYLYAHSTLQQCRKASRNELEYLEIRIFGEKNKKLEYLSTSWK